MGDRSTNAPNHDEHEELRRLRRRVAELEAEVDVLRKIVMYLGTQLSDP